MQRTKGRPGLTTDLRPPPWLDLLVRTAAFAVVAVGLAGVPLGLSGQLRRAPTALGAAVIFVALTVLWRRHQRRGSAAGDGGGTGAAKGAEPQAAAAPEVRVAAGRGGGTPSGSARGEDGPATGTAQSAADPSETASGTSEPAAGTPLAGAPDEDGPAARTPQDPTGRLSTVVALLALLVAITSGAVNAANHYEHLIVDGDPAVYAATGALLARTGDLVVPTQREELYGGNETINVAGAGFFPTEGEPTIYPQFFHLLPVLLAVATWLGGTTLMLVVNPLLGAAGLLAFYAFAARVVRPVWALVCMLALSVLLPQVHFSRDTFSEVLSQLLVFAGLALLWDVTRRPTAIGGLVAGLVLGASAMARIDAFLYLVPLTIALLLVRAGRTGLAVAAGLAVPVAIALADGYLASPVYVESVRGPLLQTAAALVLVAGAAAVTARRVPRWVPHLGSRLAVPAAVLTVALAAFAWFVRPYVQTTRRIPDRTNATIADLQAREGLPVDVPRSYDEETMVWLSWYLGPVALALGVVGLAYLAYRILKGRDLRLAPFVLLVGLATAVYVWHPGIFPVQYWASRRFLPVTFPGLILLAVLLCQRLHDARPRLATRALAAAGAAAVLVFPLALLPGATLPRSYFGLQTAFEQMCGALLPTDVVLLVGGPPATTGLPQAVMGYCGVAAASAGRATSLADLEQIQRTAEQQGRRFVLLSPTPDPFLAPNGTTFTEVFDVTVPTQALSLSKRPDAAFPYRVRLFSAVL